jgi:hypothetical protein|tara:strand:- start:1121 stop:1450 length:330 start_codon:yes stop_codon:yes gene_type:complete
MATSNVIRFPFEGQSHPPQSEEELRKSLLDVKQRFVTASAVEFAFGVFRNMEQSGCDIKTDEKARHDLILISESIKSAMYRSVGMDHPLQKFAADVVEISEADIEFIEE